MESQKKKRHNFGLLISCISLNNITSIFIYTFLTAHILNLSKLNMLNLALFYLITHITMTVLVILIAPLLEKWRKSIFLQTGVIFKFLFLLFILLLKDNLVSYIYVVAIFNGISECVYWSGINPLKSDVVPAKKIKSFALLSSILSNTIGIVIPLVFGKLLDLYPFKFVTIAMIVISGAQIVISFFIREANQSDGTITYGKFFKTIRDTHTGPEFRLAYFTSFLYGIKTNVSTVILYMTVLLFHTNISLGIFSTIGSILTIGVMTICNLSKQKRVNIWAFLIYTILPAACLLTVTFALSKTTLIIFNVIFAVCTCIPDSFNDARRFKLTKGTEFINFQVENIVCSEFFMNIGRMVGEAVLIIMAVCASVTVNRVCLIVMCVALIAYILMVLVTEKRVELDTKVNQVLNDDNDSTILG